MNLSNEITRCFIVKMQFKTNLCKIEIKIFSEIVFVNINIYIHILLKSND